VKTATNIRPQKVKLEQRRVESVMPAELRRTLNDLAGDVKVLGDAHDVHDDSLQSLPAMAKRAVRSGVFSSAASGVSSVSLTMPKPEHITLTLRRDDAADFAAVWSWWWVVSGAQVVLKFIGLPASTRCLYTVEFF
jgi:hypothetical protein